jgi:heptosyltransferase-3
MKSVPKQPRQILVTSPQRLGDVLLTTALVHSLKQAWPEAQIDVLVLRGTEGVLAGNPDIRKVLTQVQRLPWWQKLREAARLWRRYDIGVAAIPTDRSRLYAWLGASFCVGFLTEKEAGKTAWLDRHVMFDDLDTHTVAMQAQLAELLAVKPVLQVVPPQASAAESRQLAQLLPQGSYVVLHPCPKFRYKMWQPDGWIALAEWLHAQGHAIVFSGGGDADERAYVAAIEARLAFPCSNLAGQLSLAQSSSMLKGAALYVGPDTVVTHLAAACGVPTLALFGPSNPVKWGPWPSGWHEPRSPWARVGSAQHGNVFVLQGISDCVPCMLEGCERHEGSPSACLDEMPAQRVIEAAQSLLSRRTA